MKRVDYFNKIDTKKKAYILGFLAGDGCIMSNENRFGTQIALKDKAITKFIQSELGGSYKENLIENKQKRIFPSSSITVYSKKTTERLLMLFGGKLKPFRSLPRIPKELEKYMILGFFDAEGCITWGYRKDRNRLWQKVSFTSQFKMLESVQKILLSNEISTAIKPKSDGDCFVIEFANDLDILKYYEYLPKDMIILQRKFVGFQNWKKELVAKYSAKVGDLVFCVDKRTLKKYNIESYEKGFVGGRFIVDKNETHVTLSDGEKYSKKHVRKSGNSNYALRLKLDEIGENYG